MTTEPSPKKPILKSLRKPDVKTTVVSVRAVRFGDGSYPIVAGPVAVESEEQLMTVAVAARKSGASMLRAGTFRAEESPYGFKGLGEDAIWLLEHAGRQTGLPTVTEVLDSAHLDLIADHIDMLEIGPENMQNFVLLRDAGRTGKPIILTRGPSATVDEVLMAAEYILAENNPNLVLCERGSRGFDPRTTDTVDITAIPAIQQLSHLPIIIHPAPAKGGIDLMEPLAMAGRSAGADGLIVSVHPDPDNALAGNGGQMTVKGFTVLMDRLGIPAMRDEIDRLDREIIKLLKRRLHSSIGIAHIKVARGLPLRSPDREAELLDEAADDAVELGIDPIYVRAIMEVVLKHSRSAQERAVGTT
ncbi:MAG: 3-deoxy-7-phosphoheptulonate synthase [Actinobacteria bacterium]|nr:3-deoxy-7-phosphoheptulonate synthase [Actinomycetota bacterium]